MSVVIMIRSGKELFLFGDKKSTHIDNFDREKETYEVQSVSYDSRKVYQIKDDIIVGMVGSSLGYDNLFRYVINNQQVEKDVADMMEDYQDFVHNWLDYQYDDIKKYFDNNTQLSGIEKMFGAIVCGIKDGKFYGTIYGYPADESADGREQEIGEYVITVLSAKNYQDLYKRTFRKFYEENGNNIVSAVESTLKTMSKIDDTISEQFDVVKICLN
mgnify:CR=1 FL=1|jgi:hypothetical protein